MPRRSKKPAASEARLRAMARQICRPMARDPGAFGDVEEMMEAAQSLRRKDLAKLKAMIDEEIPRRKAEVTP